MKMEPGCEACLLGKYLPKHPQGASEGQIRAYQAELQALAPLCREGSAPEMAERMEAAYHRHFGQTQPYDELKRHFNDLMLRELPRMTQAVEASDDPLTCAVGFAMAGNFIDFGAMDSVDEGTLHAQLAQDRPLPADVLMALRREVMAAQRLNPALEVTVIVRGQPVLNDATLADAMQVGLSEVAHRVIGSGSGVAGTVLHRLSAEAAQAVARADVLISKGQGNYESLSGCALNVFYIFMCKCSLFTGRFGVPLYGGVLARE